MLVMQSRTFLDVEAGVKKKLSAVGIRACVRLGPGCGAGQEPSCSSNGTDGKMHAVLGLFPTCQSDEF